MMKSKLLFVIPSFGLGGTNTSLINLLSNLDNSKYESSVYAISEEGPTRSLIEERAKVLNSSKGAQGKPSFIRTLSKNVYRIIKLIGIDLSPLYYKFVAKKLSDSGFDCIVAFQEGSATRLVSYCNGPRLIAWVRSDYKRYLQLARKKPEHNIYSRYSVIVNVSKTANKVFLQELPEFEGKTIDVYNFLNEERVLELSEEELCLPGDNTFTIVSIGRIDPVKGFKDIPIIAKYLKEQKVSFRWFIIGGKTKTDPQEYNQIEKMIIEFNLGENVFLTGAQINPYKYLKHADLYVCLSLSETFNHTFGEARLLGVPVVSSFYESAPEFLNYQEGGLVIERDEIGPTILSLIKSKDRYCALKKNVQNFYYDNQAIVDKLTTTVLCC